MNTTERIELKDISTKLLNPETTAVEVEQVINQLYAYFQEFAEISLKEEDLDHLAAVPAKAGKALSFNHAAECLLDYKRTVKFLKGFVQAIKDKQEQYPNETIQVFYAGCGPLAPFVTLVAPLFTAKEIQFSLLEINNKSIRAAKKLIQKLELSDYVQEYHMTDAITFTLPNPEKIHILFSETLDSLLHRECYVPILWNLLPQLPKETTIIPGNVQIKLCFKEGGKETPAGVVFDVRKALSENKKTKELPEKFPSMVVSLADAEQYYSVILDTEVQIYKDQILTRSESSLTLALEIPIEKPVTHKGVEFFYNLKPEPSLQLKMQ